MQRKTVSKNFTEEYCLRTFKHWKEDCSKDGGISLPGKNQASLGAFTFKPLLRNYKSSLPSAPLQELQDWCQKIPPCSSWPVQERQELQPFCPSSGTSRLMSGDTSLQPLDHEGTLGPPYLKPLCSDYWRSQTPATLKKLHVLHIWKS